MSDSSLPCPSTLVSTVLATTSKVEEKRPEDALLLSEERFRAALKNSRTAVFNLDRDLRYTWMYNPQVEKPMSAYLGKTVGDLVGPEAGQIVEEVRRKVMETGQGARVQLPTKVEGKIRYFDMTVELIFDATGVVIGFTGASADITEHKQAECALRVSEERLRLAVRVAGLGISELLLQDRRVAWSPEVFNIFGVPADAPQPSLEDVKGFVHPEDRLQVDEQFHLLLAGKAVQFSHRIIRADGTVRWIELSAQAEFDAGGQAVRGSRSS